jgi:YD repeat-containing protein
MKTFFYILIIPFFIFSCVQNEELKSSNSNGNTDWKKYNLNGKVKSFRETKFLAVDNFSIIVNGKKSNHLFNKEMLFNLDGYKIEKNDYMPDGTLASRTMYLYQNNKLVEYNNYDSQGMPFGTGNYEYNADGQIVRLIDNTTDGRHNWTKAYQYDSKGNLVEVDNFKAADVIDTKEKYTYGNNGHLIKSDLLKSDKVLSRSNHKYDEDGNLIELNYGDSDLYTFRYSYDFKGNWVKKIVFENDNPSGILLREIEYFK